jgi:hypothetical protein
MRRKQAKSAQTLDAMPKSVEQKGEKKRVVLTCLVGCFVSGLIVHRIRATQASSEMIRLEYFDQQRKAFFPVSAASVGICLPWCCFCLH